MKDTIIMLPTLREATYYWERFYNIYRDVIIKVNKPQLKVKLLNGATIYFCSVTQGQRITRGLHADICSIDDFINQNELDQELRDIACGKESEDV